MSTYSPIYLDVYLWIYLFLFLSISRNVPSPSSYSPFPPISGSCDKQARLPANLPASPQGTCHHVAALMTSVFSRFSCSPAAVVPGLCFSLPFPPVSLTRAVAHCKQVGHTNSCGLQTGGWTPILPHRLAACDDMILGSTYW